MKKNGKFFWRLKKAFESFFHRFFLEREDESVKMVMMNIRSLVRILVERWPPRPESPLLFDTVASLRPP